MKIKPVDMSEQLRMMRGAGAASPKPITPPATDGVGATQKQSFTDFLQNHFNDVNAQGVEMEKAIERSVQGKEVNPHSTLIAIQKASVSMTLMMGVKEKLERAYQELIRTPIG